MAFVIQREEFDRFLEALGERSRRVLGPVARDGAIRYGNILSSADLPIGVGCEQGPGRFRLTERGDRALFGFTPGQDSWKRHLYPPQRDLFRAERSNGEVRIRPEPLPQGPTALLGVRPCELAALDRLDRALLGGPHPDRDYAARRRNALIVAVHCTEPAATCFCASLDTGPRAGGGFDLALTEVLEPGNHWFLVEAGTEQGKGILAGTPHRRADQRETHAARALVARAAGAMRRELDPRRLKPALEASFEHPIWKETAERCFTCGGCTMVCPTCFCHTTRDHQALSGGSAVRSRAWDSCFNLEFTLIHGGSVRASPESRYRQWMTHKLAASKDQFDALGCVGCGRCITWCPAGIDITEQAAALLAAQGGTPHA